MSLNISQIDTYISALIENARELIKESEILFNSNAYARSYTLAHIAREEISKCKILYAAGRRLISGVEVDWKLTMRRLRDHKAKLRQETVHNSFLVALAGDKELLGQMLSAVEYSSVKRNDDKNNSLYVGIDSDGKITNPTQIITRDLAERTIKLAKYAFDEEFTFQTKMGRLADMDVDSIPNIKFIDKLSAEQKYKLFKSMALFVAKTNPE
jgi:AbiV family abortive infection protein